MGTFIPECSIQYCSIIYPTGLRDQRKTALHQGVSCSIDCILSASKSVIKNEETNKNYIGLGHPKSGAPVAQIGYPRKKLNFDLSLVTLQ